MAPPTTVDVINSKEQCFRFPAAGTVSTVMMQNPEANQPSQATMGGILQ